MALTIYDIARESGFSHTAVAAVLAGRAKKLRISEASAARIRKVAARLGYRPNAIAQAFTSGRTNVIGLILSSPRREFLGRILDGAMAAANERGLLLKTISTEAGGVSFRAALEQCLQHRVAGLLVCDLRVENFPADVSRQMPICFINCNRQRSGFAVDPDDSAGAAAAVEHLYQLGHRRIAFISGRRGDVDTVDRRRQGFLKAMKKHRLALPADWAPYTANKAESTYEAARELLSLRERPTAILCATDPRAGVVLQVARELSIDVPADLSVIGFSDDTLAQYTQPPLTTIRQPHSEIGRFAIDTIAEATQDMRVLSRMPAQTLMPTELLIRESTSTCSRS